MPVIQGGSVVYDQTASARENWKALQDSLQGLMVLRQNQQKLAIDAMDKAFQMFEAARTATGLPLQPFLGTPIGAKSFDQLMQVYSAATGRVVSGDTARELANMTAEYNANYNNWSTEQKAQFFASRISLDYQGSKDTATASQTQGVGGVSQQPRTGGGSQAPGTGNAGQAPASGGPGQAGGISATGRGVVTPGAGQEPVSGVAQGVERVTAPVAQSSPVGNQPIAQPTGGAIPLTPEYVNRMLQRSEQGQPQSRETPQRTVEGGGLGQPIVVGTDGSVVPLKVYTDSILAQLAQVQTGNSGASGIVNAPQAPIAMGPGGPIPLSPGYIGQTLQRLEEEQPQTAPTAVGEVTSQPSAPNPNVAQKQAGSPGMQVAPREFQRQVTEDNTPPVAKQAPNGETTGELDPRKKFYLNEAYKHRELFESVLVGGKLEDMDSSELASMVASGRIAGTDVPVTRLLGMIENGDLNENELIDAAAKDRRLFDTIVSLKDLELNPKKEGDKIQMRFYKNLPDGTIDIIETPFVLGVDKPPRGYSYDWSRANISHEQDKNLRMPQQFIDLIESGYREIPVEDSTTQSNLLDRLERAKMTNAYAQAGGRVILDFKSMGTALDAALAYAAKPSSVQFQGIGGELTSLLDTLKKSLAGVIPKDTKIFTFEDLANALDKADPKNTAVINAKKEIFGVFSKLQTNKVFSQMIDEIKTATPQNPDKAVSPYSLQTNEGVNVGQTLETATKTEGVAPESPVNKTTIKTTGKTVTPTEAAKAKAPDVIWSGAPVVTTYTGPKASDPIKNENKVIQAMDTIQRALGNPTTTFKQKSEVHQAAVTAGSWLNSVWNMLKPEERMAMIKEMDDFVQNISASSSYFTFGKDFASQKLLSDYYKTQAAIAATDALKAQQSIITAGLKESIGIITETLKSIGSTTTALETAAISKGTSPKDLEKWIGESGYHTLWSNKIYAQSMEIVKTILSTFGISDFANTIEKQILPALKTTGALFWKKTTSEYPDETGGGMDLPKDVQDQVNKTVDNILGGGY